MQKAQKGIPAWKIFKKGYCSGFVGHSASDYRLWYEKGVVVKELSGTVGIFAFEKKKDAEEYARRNTTKPDSLFVCKVVGIGQKRDPGHVGYANNIRSFYMAEEGRKKTKSPFHHPKDYQRTPKGTVFFKAIVRIEDRKEECSWSLQK